VFFLGLWELSVLASNPIILTTMGTTRPWHLGTVCASDVLPSSSSTRYAALTQFA
jgi:hypothetical protein